MNPAELRAKISKLFNGSDSVESKAASSGAWLALTQAAVMVMKFGSNMILAWLLTPHDFGTFAIVFTVITGIAMLTDVGFDTAIVRNPNGATQHYLDVVWTMQTFRGIGIWAVCCLVAYPVSLFYHEAVLVFLLPATSLVVVTAGMQTTYFHVCERELNLRPRVVLEFQAQFLSIIVQITFAYFHPSAWALCAGVLSGELYRLVRGHLMNPYHRHRFTLDKAISREVFHVGKWIFISTAIFFVGQQIDRITLAKFFSLEMLGVYTLAFTVANIPREIGNQLAGRVLLPLYAEFNRSTPEEMNQRIHNVRGVLLPIYLAMTICVVVGAQLFFSMYKPIYALAGWIAPILAAFFWVSILQNSVDRVSLALGNSRVLATGSSVGMAARVSGVFLGFYYPEWLHYLGIDVDLSLVTEKSRLFGFLVSLIVAAFIEYVFIGVVIRRYGIKVRRQDAFYSGVLLAISLLFLYLSNALLFQTMLGRIVLSVLLASATLLLMGRLAFIKYKSNRLR